MLGALLGGSRLGAVLAPFESSVEEMASALLRQDNTRALRLLRAGGNDIKCLDAQLSSGLTLVHLAAAANALEVLLELAIAGADLDVPAADGSRPLHIAARHSHRAAVELLLRYGADASVPDGDGQLAMELTEEAAVQQLLMRDRRPPTVTGFAELRSKLAQNSVALKLQESQSRLVKSAERSSQRPGLMGAASLEWEGAVDDVKEEKDELSLLVLEAAFDTAKWLKCSLAENSNMFEMIKFCSMPDNDNKPRQLAAFRARLLAEPALTLCRSCGMGNIAPDGFTPLHVAAQSNYISVILMLLAIPGVSCWVRDLQGRTPLHVAAAYSRDEACRVLREAMLRERPQCDPIGSGAPVDLTGTTPLGWASFKLDRRPPPTLERILFSPGDRSVLPLTPRHIREGSSGVKKAARSAVMTNFFPNPQQPHLGELSYGFAEAGGWRPSMEDRVFVRCPLIGVPDVALFGVMDGHGGDFCSTFLADNLPTAIEVALKGVFGSAHKHLGADRLRVVLSEAFSTVEAKLQSHPRMMVDVLLETKGDRTLRRIAPVVDRSGSTAVVVCLTPTFIAVANCGDSRAVLARKRQMSSSSMTRLNEVEAVAMSRDHKPHLEGERARIEAAGGVVTELEGGACEVGFEGSTLRLRMSRAFGDFYLKQAEGLASNLQPIIAVPEVQVISRSPGDILVLVACDGVWDVMSNEAAVQLVMTCLADGSSIAEACDVLLHKCLTLGTTDNMTVMCVLLDAEGVIVHATGLDTPPLHMLSLDPSSIGSAMRSDDGQESGPAESRDSCKKNLTLEYD
jgi:protein phosphatase 1G